METENKYKTFGELKVGDKIIAFDDITNAKYEHEVSKIKIARDCDNSERARCWLDGSNNGWSRLYPLADVYVAPCNNTIFISDADNADKIIEEVRIKKEREHKEEVRQRNLRALRMQAQKNPPRFITLKSNASKEEFIINVDSIRTVWKNENFSIVYFEGGLKISVDNDYEEIKAKLGL